MAKIFNSEVAEIFKKYPPNIRQKLLVLRQLVFDTVAELEGAVLEETLKWGEPSYLTKHGSTIRMDWIRSSPDQYALYFNCKTKLVDTFKKLYPTSFRYEGNRAIVFSVDEAVPVDQLRHCILLALTYHSRKNLPLLGV